MDQRRFARIQVSLRLKFKSLSALENRRDGHTSDLSLGGMFIQSAEVKPMGTKVEIELPGPNETPVLIYGVVRFIKYQNGQPFGMGIEFEDLATDAREIIAAIVEKNTAKAPGS